MDNDVTVRPCEAFIDFENSAKYSKLPLSADQKERMSYFLQYLPQAKAANTLAHAWVAHFPKGYSHLDMMRYKAGGVGNTLVGKEGIETYAPLFSLERQAISLGLFTLLSAATGQYFLARIDKQLSLVNQKLDDVLNFLYGENRAELLAEISFVKRSYENFSSIMISDYQRTATIIGLQSAQKTAIKDLEFYLSDLEKISHKPHSDFRTLCKHETEAWQALKCIEMALQTCVISTILEIYYSENYDKTYIDYTHQSMIAYINRCNAVVISVFMYFDACFREYHAKPFENVEERQRYRSLIKQTLVPYKNEADSPLRKTLDEALKAVHKECTYYIDNSGNVYTKKEA